jgi:hypothetical protein
MLVQLLGQSAIMAAKAQMPAADLAQINVF